MPKATSFKHRSGDQWRENTTDHTRCPCRRCILTNRLQTWKTIRRHLLRDAREDRQRARHNVPPAWLPKNISTSTEPSLHTPSRASSPSPPILDVHDDRLRGLARSYTSDDDEASFDGKLAGSLHETSPEDDMFFEGDGAESRWDYSSMSPPLSSGSSGSNLAPENSGHTADNSDWLSEDENEAPVDDEIDSCLARLAKLDLEGSAPDEADHRDAASTTDDGIFEDLAYEEPDDPAALDDDYPDTLETNDSSTATLPPAFSEHPIIRNIYIRVFLNAAFNRTTHEGVRLQLEGHYKALLATQAHFGIEFEGLDHIARTLPTLEKRLGVDPNQYITYYFVCNKCWFRHHPSELEVLESPHCTREYCEGLLYTVTTTTKGCMKRTPTKLLPVSRLVPALQRILRRPGKYQELQQWRRDGDQPQLNIPPIIIEGMGVFQDPSVPLRDISDGWGWRAVQAGLDRRRGDGPWKIEDVDVHEINQRHVSLPLGLMFMVNIDWYVRLIPLVGFC